MEDHALSIVLAILFAVEFYLGKKAIIEQAKAFSKEREALLDRITRLSLAKSLSEYVASEDEEPCRTWNGDESVDLEERDIARHSERN